MYCPSRASPLFSAEDLGTRMRMCLRACNLYARLCSRMTVQVSIRITIVVKTGLNMIFGFALKWPTCHFESNGGCGEDIVAFPVL